MSNLYPSGIFNCGNFNSGFLEINDLKYFSRFWFLLSTGNVIVTADQPTGNIVSGDFVYALTPSTVTTKNVQVTPYITTNTIGYTPSFEYVSNNSGIATVNNSGYVQWVQNGNVDITTRAIGNTGQNILNKNVTIEVFQTISGQTKLPNYFNTGCLGSALTTGMGYKIDGLTANNSTKSVYSTQNHTSGIYVRSSTCWGKDFDWTGVSPWNSTGGGQRAGTLISPCHIIFAKHFQIDIGATIRFITQDNIVITRTITNKYSISTDITIGKLDTDVPETIKFYKIIDTINNPNKCTKWGWIPLTYFDQEEKLLTFKTNYSNGSKINGTDFYMTQWNYINEIYYPSYYTQFNAFYELPIGGDSGNPIFMIVNNEPVIVSTFWGSNSGPLIAYYKDAINEAMNILGGEYQLTEIDISSFPDF